jgi:hypothetical protein
MSIWFINHWHICGGSEVRLTLSKGAKYLQEVEGSDPSFYVPPVKGASFRVADNLSAN